MSYTGYFGTNNLVNYLGRTLDLTLSYILDLTVSVDVNTLVAVDRYHTAFIL